MSEAYIALNPKTLECVEVGLTETGRAVAAANERLVVILSTKRAAKRSFLKVFESLEDAQNEAARD